MTSPHMASGPVLAALGLSAYLVVSATDVAFGESAPSSMVNIPTACMDGRPWDGGEDAVLPTMMTRRCVFPGAQGVGTNGGVTYFDSQTGDIIRMGGLSGLWTSGVSNSTAVTRTRPHVYQVFWSTSLDKTKWPERALGAGVFDPIARRLIYYGGVNKSNTLLPDVYVNDTLALPVDNPNGGWITLQIPPPGAARYWAQAVYDPVGHRMVVYGGRGQNAAIGNQTLALDLTIGAEQWSVLDVAITPPGKSETIGHGLAYDRVRHRVMLMAGGTAFGGPIAYNHVWVLDLMNTSTGWKQLQPVNEGPGAGLVGVSAFCSPENGDCYLHSGAIFNEPKKYGLVPPAGYVHSFWRIRMVSDEMFEWSRIRTAAPFNNSLETRIHWSEDLGLGISAFGFDRKAGADGTIAQSKEIRVYQLFEGMP